MFPGVTRKWWQWGWDWLGGTVVSWFDNPDKECAREVGLFFNKQLFKQIKFTSL